MRIVSWLLVALALLGVWTAWRMAPVDRSVGQTNGLVLVQGAVGSVETHPIPVDSLGQRVIGRNLFRRDRRPAPTRLTEYDQRPPALPVPIHRPRLRLTGIISGTMPSAVIDGVPGVSGGAVMVPGDTLQGLVLEAIVGDTARVIGADTTWTLVLRRSSE